MAISGREAFDRVRGWAGLILSITPFLLYIPIPAVQAVVVPVQEFLLAMGGAGVALQATSASLVKPKNP
jgi:uncharacterized RDD family membrane protein YckC